MSETQAPSETKERKNTISVVIHYLNRPIGHNESLLSQMGHTQKNVTLKVHDPHSLMVSGEETAVEQFIAEQKTAESSPEDLVVFYDHNHPKTVKNRFSPHFIKVDKPKTESHFIKVDTLKIEEKRQEREEKDQAKERISQSNNQPQALSQALKTAFTAADIAKIYQLPSLTPKSTVSPKIGIISLGGNLSVSDCTAYWKAMGTSATKVTIKLVDQSTLPPSSDANLENLLDVQISGTLCPGATVNFYSAPNTDLGFKDAVYAAYKDKVNVISISWGAPESSWETDRPLMLALNQTLQLAASAGITTCVASGDNGSGDGTYALSVDFPASSPNVLAVGGTSLYATTTNQYSSETVWSWNTTQQWGTGGGLSQVFAQPSWQAAITYYGETTKPKVPTRFVPDVALNADPNTPWIVYMNGSATYVGGTSCAAPAVAGAFANLHCNMFVAPLLYAAYTKLAKPSLASFVHLITVGNNASFGNGKYTASPTGGFSLCTGVGSLQGTTYNSILSPPTSTTAHVAPAVPAKPFVVPRLIAPQVASSVPPVSTVFNPLSSEVSPNKFCSLLCENGCCFW